MEQLWTSEEVAEFLHVDPVTVRRLINKGELSAYRIGADYRIAPADLQSYLQRQRIAASKEESTASNAPLQIITRWLENKHRGRMDEARYALMVDGGERLKNAQSITEVKEQLGTKLTEPVRHVLDMAELETRTFAHNFVGAKHLLIALLREGEGIASRSLNNLGLTLAKLNTDMERIVGHGDPASIRTQIGLTKRAKKALILALSEARHLGDQAVDTEHLLLGLLRENENVAIALLEANTLSPEQVRQEVMRMVKEKSSRQHDDADSDRYDPPTNERPHYICGNCHTHNSLTAKYCTECGTSLAEDADEL